MSAASEAGTGSTADYVRIFDTTLRDGEQAPGCTMSLKEKLEVARQLTRLGVAASLPGVVTPVPLTEYRTLLLVALLAIAM